MHRFGVSHVKIAIPVLEGKIIAPSHGKNATPRIACCEESIVGASRKLKLPGWKQLLVPVWTSATSCISIPSRRCFLNSYNTAVTAAAGNQTNVKAGILQTWNHFPTFSHFPLARGIIRLSLFERSTVRGKIAWLQSEVTDDNVQFNSIARAIDKTVPAQIAPVCCPSRVSIRFAEKCSVSVFLLSNESISPSLARGERID